MLCLFTIPTEFVKNFSKATLDVSIIVKDGKVVSVGGSSATEVITCKSCRHYQDSTHLCLRTCSDVAREDYCSFAKKCKDKQE